MTITTETSNTISVIHCGISVIGAILEDLYEERGEFTGSVHAHMYLLRAGFVVRSGDKPMDHHADEKVESMTTEKKVCCADFLFVLFIFDDYINGLVQERRNSSALAMELRLSYTDPSIWELEEHELIGFWEIWQ